MFGKLGHYSKELICCNTLPVFLLCFALFRLFLFRFDFPLFISELTLICIT